MVHEEHPKTVSISMPSTEIVAQITRLEVEVSALRTDVDMVKKGFIGRDEFMSLLSALRGDMERIERQHHDRLNETKIDLGRQLSEHKSDFGIRLTDLKNDVLKSNDELKRNLMRSNDRAFAVLGLVVTVVTFLANFIFNILR